MSEAIRFLETLEHKGWHLGLERIQRLLELMGHPEQGPAYFHVAGTNGKGSTAAMLAQILWKAGIPTARFISPHLIRYNERFWFNGCDILDKDLDRIILDNRQAILQAEATLFEALTAIAFAHFKERGAKAVVLEVGLGGRLDATNVIKPLASIITNVTIEHTQWLGKTLKEISAEKAGIIKPGVPVITNAEGEALEVIKAEAYRQKAPIFIRPDQPPCPILLIGDYQRENAALAVEALRRQDRFRITETAVREGLATVEWPGRMQRVGNLILDCAHNPGAMARLLENVPAGIPAIIGILKDKDYPLMMRMLSEKVSHFILTEPKTDRACPAEELAKHAGKPFVIVPSVAEAIKEAKKEKGPVLVTGSCYTVGEALLVGFQLI
ncbi:MAG: folylpolyglutamate synthase/dihydrofolate synthase family protein [Nanoarchaeota archaeon]